MSYAFLCVLDKEKVANLREKYNIPNDWSDIAQGLDRWFLAFETYPLDDDWARLYLIHDDVSSSDSMMLMQTLMVNIPWLSQVALELSFVPVETQDELDGIIKRIKEALTID